MLHNAPNTTNNKRKPCLQTLKRLQLRRNYNMLHNAPAATDNNRKPCLQTLKRLQLRRRSKVAKRRGNAREKLEEDEWGNKGGDFNVEELLDRLVENFTAAKAPPPPPPSPPPPTPSEARKSLVITRRKSQRFNDLLQLYNPTIADHFEKASYDNNSIAQKKKTKRRSLKLDSSMIASKDTRKQRPSNLENNVDYLTKKKILHESDYEKLLKLLKTINPHAIIQQDGAINNYFINWRKVQHCIREELL
jgi:hypothetical protein